jgi:amino acid efflux transporter
MVASTSAAATPERSHGTVTIPGAVALYIGSVLGGGILVLPGLTAQMAGWGAIVAWAAVTLLSWPLALLFGRLSSLYPDAGGVSAFARRAFGRAAGDLTGWLYFWILPVGQPAVMLSGMAYLGYSFDLSRETVFLLAGGVLVVSGMVNAFGRTLSNRAQLAVAGCIVGILVTTVVVSVPDFSYEHLARPIPHGIASVGAAAALIMWAYIGWENVSFIAEDFRNPRRDFPISVVLSVIVVGLLYTGATVAVLGSLPGDALSSQAPLAEVMSRSLGVSAGVAASVAATLIVTASAMAFVWGGSNLAASLAAHGSFPKRLASRRENVPLAAIVWLELAYLIGLTTIYFTDTSLATLGQIVGAAVIMTYMSSALAYLRLVPRKHLRDLVTPVFVLAFSVVLVPFFGASLLYPVAITEAIHVSHEPAMPSLEEQRRHA